MLIGTAYSMTFKKRFIDSLAPAFFVQILLMLLTGITIERLSLGILIGMVMAVGIISFLCVRDRSFARLVRVFKVSENGMDLGICLFVFVYFFIFLSNVGKHYNMWDEFSHWGWFVRESYNDDFLYCISHRNFAHKEYVPGVSLFEVLWCRLSLKYSEPNAYRGIQMLQAAMLLPLVMRVPSTIKGRFSGNGRRLLMIVVNLFIVFSIPLFSELPFYHTLYEDLIMGVFVFYCVWVTISDDFSRYSLFLLGISMSCLVLCKMTSLAFLPILFLFYVVWHSLFAKREIARRKIFIGAITSTVSSIIPWILYNRYLGYKGVNSGTQNYGSIKLSSVLDVIAHNGKIVYQKDVDEAFFTALAKKGIIGNLSYVWIVLGSMVLLVLFMLVLENKEYKKKVGLVTLWLFLTGIYYAVVMYFMYMLLFSEYEATGVASFKRYMSSYVLVALLLVAMAFIVYGTARFRFVSYLAAILLAENIAVFFGASQMLPGVFTHDEVWYEGHVDYLNNSIPQGGSVLFICSLSDQNAIGRVQFYCKDISLGSGIFGPPKYDGDVWSQDLSVDEFVSLCSGYDYIYFFSYDDSFIDIYQNAFEEREVISVGRLFRVKKTGGKIRTYPVS
jgi:hypothetical protein